MSDRLNSGQDLTAGQNLTSPNGSYQLCMQGEGNLVLYRIEQGAGTPLWATNDMHPIPHPIPQPPPCVCAMQGDGNLVLYDGHAQPYWASNTFTPNVTLVLHDDGSLVLEGPPVPSEHVLVAADPNPPTPSIPPIEPPKGLTRMSGRVVLDDSGPMNALGTTLMWGLWGYKFDRSRLQRHFEWGADNGLGFFRMFGEVRDKQGQEPPFWRDQAIVPVGSDGYPEWPDYEGCVQGCTQMAIDHGMRIEWSVFGSGLDHKRRTCERFVAGVKPVMTGMQMGEVANENQGFGEAGVEMRQLASYLRSQLGAVPLALTAIGEDPAMVHALYDGSAADIFTFHFERTMWENGWRPVRQPWGGKDFGAFSNNEPVGDHSSVESDTDPERITIGAVNAWLTGASHTVIHTGAGVRGVDDPARGRVANLWDVTSMGPVLAALKKIRAILPPGLSGWTRENFCWSGHPFEMGGLVGDPALAANHGCVRCFAAHNGSQFVTLPFGVMQYFVLKAKAPMRVKLYAWTGDLIQELQLDSTGVIGVSGGRRSMLIVGENL